MTVKVCDTAYIMHFFLNLLELHVLLANPPPPSLLPYSLDCPVSTLNTSMTLFPKRKTDQTAFYSICRPSMCLAVSSAQGLIKARRYLFAFPVPGTQWHSVNSHKMTQLSLTIPVALIPCKVEAEFS